MSTHHNLHQQLSASLQARHNLPVSPQWLHDFLSSRGSNPPPLPALVSTAHFRILASDITTSLRPCTTKDMLPRDVSDVNIKDRRLTGPVIVQVLDIIDVGTSKWSQVEAIERVERGEEMRGREVIRTVDDRDEGGPSLGPGNKLTVGPHKLLLQDAKGTKVLAFELVRVPGIAISVAASASASAALPASNQTQNQHSMARVVEDPGMFIGSKLLLKPGTVVRRGMVMLTPDNCVVLGGKVEAWDKKWKEERKTRLTTLVSEENGAGA